MSRFRYETTEQKIETWLKEGRGKGEGEKYTPWITVFDFPSRGLVSRDKGVKTGRIEHVFSNNEDNTLSINSLAKYVVDIREQYPLLPLDETLLIAQKKNIKHPSYPDTKVHVVMTTDFYLTVRLPNGEKVNVARTVKQKSDLNSYRTIEKLEIERIYWKSRGVDWGIIVAELIPKYFAKNCQELIPFYLEERLQISRDDLMEIYEVMTPIVLEKKQPLRLIAKQSDAQLGLRRGTSVKATRHFIATQRWVVDLLKLLDASEVLKIRYASKEYVPIIE